MITHQTVRKIPEIEKVINELGLNMRTCQIVPFSTKCGMQYSIFYDEADVKADGQAPDEPSKETDTTK